MADNELALRTDYTPAVIADNLPEVGEWLAGQMKPYEGMDDAALEGMTRKELADQRSFINKEIIERVESERKRMKAVYTAPLNEFEARVKEVLEPARDAVALLSRHIAAKDEQKREGYRKQLESYYKEIAGPLAEFVGFTAVFEDDWVKSDAKFKAAFEALHAKCSRLADDWAALKKMRDSLYDFEAAERMLFGTFDLRATMDADEKAREDSLKLAQMKEDLGMAEPEPQPDPMPAYEPPHFEEVHEPVYMWKFIMSRNEFKATERKKSEFTSLLKELGIKGKLQRIGEVA